MGKRVDQHTLAIWLAGACLAVATGAHAAAKAQTHLADLSIEELGDIEVTSVSKQAQTLSEAPSAIYVITHDEIARSGANTIPEILRLAPNLQVAQTGATHYVITARGFNGASAAQSFSNKLLVLIDGRTVYTPLYSGVYWDMQDVLPADIDRIEVISGPGAALWGANAVNGVINITTRRSSDTQGGLIELGQGDQQGVAALRYGGRLSEDLTYRVYGRALVDSKTRHVAGDSANDAAARRQAGFRLDWTPSPRDMVTLQGDAYRGAEHQDSGSDETISGGNLTARWNRTLSDGGTIQAQAYFDRTARATIGDGKFSLDTYDLDAQHSFAWGRRQQITWGGGFRLGRYRINGTPTFYFSPAQRTFDLANFFVQDSIATTASTQLILALKVEDGPYLAPELLPSARFAWRATDQTTVWAAVSRAVRAPTPFDRDVVEKLGATTFLTGNPRFQSEKLTAYELGVRLQPSTRTAIAVSSFYNSYDDLRSIEVAPTGFLPLNWGNGMRGDTWGLEASADYRLTPWWRLTGGYDFLEKRLAFKPGAAGLLGVSQAGGDPKHQARLTSAMDLGDRLTLDTTLRYQSALPDPRLPAYAELNARMAWRMTDQLVLAVSGQNLLHDRHQEYPGANAIPRSVFLDLQWRF